jgi:hypothetical protein
VTSPIDASPAAPAAPAPEFEVLGATARRHAAVPALDFDVHVSEPSGRLVYTIALTAQVMIEPARRRYEAETHERLADLFGPPETWSTATTNMLWHHAELLVPQFTGATTFRISVPCSFDLEVATARYLYGLEDGHVPLAFNFNGTIFYREADGRLQMSLVPWSCSAAFSLPVATWREEIDHYYPYARWVTVHADTLDALQREKRRRGLPTLDACIGRLIEESPA